MEEEEDATIAVRNPSHHVSRPCKIKRSSDLIDGGEDSISDLPDEILHHIFSFIPTRLAIRTSVLSKRWRHVWSETPHLSFEYVSHKSISKTLVNHSASKITSFQICTSLASEAH
ncbi:F-box/LRR-repeat protein 25 [Cardamine amara subsp. amara]|uniref:F-box/LRR-repeat protein 25 n=1 Tax=Cardamine amara subsp. amara TaxID=228776 RepID=A0ABD0ZZZ9_CARAN